MFVFCHVYCDPYPVTSVLGNIFTNLLGRQTKGTDLGGQSRLGSDFTTSHSQVTIERASLELSPIRKTREAKVKDFFKGRTYMIFTSLGSNLGATQRVIC